jgi:nucleoside-diphosphate-sugar epimerase
MPMKAILLTGASGVLGEALRRSLPASTLFCLVRRTPVSGPNVIAVHGDVTQPRLGLSLHDYSELAQSIDLVIHAAANTEFNPPWEVIARTNVDGTRHVLELAATARVPMYYIGTAFSQSPGDTGGYAATNYELSKREAEAAVRASGVPHVIVRPSVIVGDSVTGAIGRFQGFHYISGLIMKGRFPIIPASPNTYLDIVPQDVVARVIAALVERGDTSGEHWLTQGEQAPTLRRLVDICVEQAPRLCGRIIHSPKMVNPEVYERLIRPVFLPALPPDLQVAFGRAYQMARYLNIDQPFPSSLAGLAHELGIGPLPSSELTMIRNLEYMLSRKEQAQNGHSPLSERRAQRRAQRHVKAVAAAPRYAEP